MSEKNKPARGQPCGSILCPLVRESGNAFDTLSCTIMGENCTFCLRLHHSVENFSPRFARIFSLRTASTIGFHLGSRMISSSLFPKLCH